MAWFSRKKDAGPPDEAPDPALTMMTVGQVARLRALVRQAFAERGIEVSVAEDYVRSEDGYVFGLWNVAATCHGDERGPAAWPELVGRHVELMLKTTTADPFDVMSRDDVLAAVHVRLMEKVAAMDLDGFAYAQEIVPGVMRVLAVDTPDVVVVPPLDRLTAHAGLDTVWDAGWRNLRKVMDRDDLRVHGVDLDGHPSAFQVMQSASVFTASLALLLPEVVQRLLPGQALSERGAFVGIPNRNELVIHVIGDPERAMIALTALPRFIVSGFDDAPGPISPHTFWWHGDRFDPITTIEDKALTVRISHELSDVLGLDAPGNG